MYSVRTQRGLASIVRRVQCVCVCVCVVYSVRTQCGPASIVYVHNAGRPALYDMCTVLVTVRDVNDHVPLFDKSQMTLEVPENAVMDSIHTVEAFDDDIGDNARISYYITGTLYHANFD